MRTPPRDAQWYRQLEKRKERALRDRVTELLGSSHSEAIESLSYGACLRMDRWAQSEMERFEEWETEVDRQRVREVGTALMTQFNQAKPSRAAIQALIEQNADLPVADLLMQVSLESSIAAVANSMRARGRRKSQIATMKHKEVAWAWLEQTIPPEGLDPESRAAWRRPSKNELSERLARQFNLSSAYVRDRILRGIEDKTEYFPDGIEAAIEQINAQRRTVF